LEADVASIEVRGLTKNFGRVTAVRGGLMLLAYAAVFATAAAFSTLRRDVT
jgi:hypothetical protein